MNIEELRTGPKVRIKICLDDRVAVIRLTLLERDGGGYDIGKECLNRLGEWVPAGEGESYLWNEFDVVKEVDIFLDPADRDDLRRFE